MRKQWGRILTLVLGGLAAVPAALSLFAVVTGEFSSLVGLIIWGGYCALVFGVLLNGQTARWFSTQRS